MDAGGVATGSYRSPDGNQHHRRLGPLSYPQGRMGCDALRYRRQQRTPHTIQRCQPVGVHPPRPFREFPLQGPAVLTRDIRTPTPLPPCQETDFPASSGSLGRRAHRVRLTSRGAACVSEACPTSRVSYSHGPPQSSPTAYALSYGRTDTALVAPPVTYRVLVSVPPRNSTFFPPTDDSVQSTSSSTSHPPRADSADLKVFCALPSGTIAAMTQTPKRLMWDSERIAVERAVKRASGTSPPVRHYPSKERLDPLSSPHTGENSVL
jgi:hypothetical protein